MSRQIAVPEGMVRVKRFYVNLQTNTVNGRHEIHWGDSRCVRTLTHRAYFWAKPDTRAMRSRALRRVRRDCSQHGCLDGCRISVCQNCIMFH